MKSFIVSSILVTLLSTVLVTAAPLPVNEGDIVAVKPSDLEGKTDPSTLRHQAVVVQNPDANNKIKVALTSSNLDSTVYPHQGDANHYHPDLKAGHAINTGEPNHVHVSNAPGSQKITTPVAADKLADLKKEINNNCGAELTRRDGSCKYTPKNRAKENHAKEVHAPAKKVGGKPVASKKAPATHSKQAPIRHK
jgi:hypothetical protein